MRKAFSLLELLIVVVIVGLIYTLALTNFEKIEEPKERVSLLNLREYLQAIEHEKNVQLLCLNGCKSCYVYVDAEHKSEYDGAFDSLVDEDVELYFYTYRNGFEALEEQIHFSDARNYENVCFSYEVDALGNASEVYILSNGRAYAPSFKFSKREFESLDAIENHLQSLRMKFN